MTRLAVRPTPAKRRARYDELRDRYAKLYAELQLIRTELNTLEAEMLERGEIEEGDIA